MLPSVRSFVITAGRDVTPATLAWPFSDCLQKPFPCQRSLPFTVQLYHRAPSVSTEEETAARQTPREAAAPAGRRRSRTAPRGLTLLASCERRPPSADPASAPHAAHRESARGQRRDRPASSRRVSSARLPRPGQRQRPPRSASPAAPCRWVRESGRQAAPAGPARPRQSPDGTFLADLPEVAAGNPGRCRRRHGHRRTRGSAHRQ